MNLESRISNLEFNLMSAFLFNFFLFTTEGGTRNESGWWGDFLHFYNEYLNYPGFEAWRFFNLALFVAIMIYLLKKPLTDAFK
ncbi:MAG: hypothetical protein H0X49_16350, partial [Acidobacteria bacterium]|nr:hypothetical protein [Acidobacteriota bacterium]